MAFNVALRDESLRCFPGEPHGLQLVKQFWNSLLTVGILVYEAY